ncbi:hypothetical protein EG328_009771 [Venturia inaequalis]|uniref:Uncharacterized protein n=1 Tax=Venturia inaequalis TaxID=5025 RepID=A0A8H3Z558_VENIN|nr:hypothetical protein EG328_009771 [Venturia inaequalis]
MRIKQRATKSFVSANNPASSQTGPSAHYNQAFKDPAATFRLLRDEDDWYLSKNPHRPNNYSLDWRAEMQRASGGANNADEAEQVGAQIQSGAARIASNAEGVPHTKPNDKRQQKVPHQPQHVNSSSPTDTSTKRRLDNFEKDDIANLTLPKRARSSDAPPTAISSEGTPDGDVFEDNETSSLCRSTRVQTSTTPPITVSSKDTAGGKDSEETGAPGLHQSTSARTSSLSPTTTISNRGIINIHQRIMINFEDHMDSVPESNASSSHSDNAEPPAVQVTALQEPAAQAHIVEAHIEQAHIEQVHIEQAHIEQAPTNQDPAVIAAGVQPAIVPDSAAPAASAKSRKGLRGSAKEFDAERLTWINKWCNDDDAGKKTYDKDLKRHQQMNRDFEKEFDLKVPLKEYSIRNKRQEMRGCGQIDGTVRTKEFYEKEENYPRKKWAKTEESRSVAGVKNASPNAQAGLGGQDMAQSSSERRKNDKENTVNGSEDVGEDEEV